eukprot:SAG22_NODE_230_length_14595_cov_50.767660_4_plen_97_part_00
MVALPVRHQIAQYVVLIRFRSVDTFSVVTSGRKDWAAGSTTLERKRIWRVLQLLMLALQLLMVLVLLVLLVPAMLLVMLVVVLLMVVVGLLVGVIW